MSKMSSPARLSAGLIILLGLALWPLSGYTHTRLAAAERLEEQLQLLIPDGDLEYSSTRVYAMEQLQGFFGDLRALNIERKAPDRAGLMIQELANTRFFKQPHSFAPFTALFKSGEFSNPSSVALYALTLEYFNIPYAIQSDRWTINILVDPAGKAVSLIHSGKAHRRTHQSEEDFVRNYLDLLRASHLLPDVEWRRPDSELFDRYYLPFNDRMTLSQLAGFLHYQQALASYRERKYLLCMDWLERAQRTSAQPAYAVLRRAALLQLANQTKGDNLESLNYLFQLWKETPLDWLGVELLNRLDRLVEREFIINPNAPDIAAVSAPFLALFHGDTDLLRQVHEIGYLKLARHYARQSKMPDMMSCLDTLYRIRPQDKAIQDVLAGMLVWSLRHEHNASQGMESAYQYRLKYPFLTEHALFRDLDLQFRAEQIRNCFDNKQIEQGRAYLAEFETMAAMYGKTTPRLASWVTTAYASSSYYYFLNKDYITARQLIEKANQLAPGDPYLEDRLAFIRHY